MDASQLVFVCIVFALSQLTLALLALWTARPLGQQQVFYAAFLLAVGAYLLDPVVHGPLTDFVLGSLTVFVPGMFFLFSASLFDDDFSLRPWHFIAVGFTVVPPITARRLHLSDYQALDVLLIEAPQLLEFCLLAYALYVAVRFWSPDLIRERRSLRLWFSGFTGCYLFLLILLREVLLPDSEVFATLQFVPPALALLVNNILLLRYRRGLWRSPAPGPPPEVVAAEPVLEKTVSSPDSEARPDPALVSAVLDLMEKQHLYREMGLTLPDLARRAELPAYRLREAINAGLGYRNFNDFLNSYRIREAAGRLRDESQREVQILVIALDAGFRSLSTFNKAFRAALATTPTEYRRRALGD